MGVSSQLGHRLTWAMKHVGSDLCSVSQLHALHYLFFTSLHTQPFTPSSLIFLSSRCPLLFGPIIFLRSSCSRLPFFRDTVRYNFPSSFRIISSAPLSASLVLTLLYFSLRTAFCPTALPPSFSTINTSSGRVRSLSQKPECQPTD